MQFLSGNTQADFQGEIEHRMKVWMRLRLMSAVFLLLLSLFFRPALTLPYPIVPILAVVLVLCGLNSLGHLLLARRNWSAVLGYVQIAIDLLVITAILQFTGGVDSPFNWFYLLLIVAAGLTGGFRLTMVVATFCIGLYAAVLLGQYYFILPHYHVGILATHADAGFRDVKLLIHSTLTSAFAFVAVGMVSGYVAETAEQRKKLIETAARVYNEAILRNVTIAQEEERKRIARDLHDDIGQSLTFLLLNLDTVREDASLPVHLKGRINKLYDLTNAILVGLRTAISNLRPAMLDDLGLIPSLKWYLKNHIEPLGIKWTVVDYGVPKRMDDITEISLYRLLQEAIINVAKHAAAREVVIIFRFESQRIRIVVQDDGEGFQPGSLPAADRWGIMGMRERLAILGGKLDISTSASEGTTLCMEIPC